MASSGLDVHYFPRTELVAGVGPSRCQHQKRPYLCLVQPTALASDAKLLINERCKDIKLLSSWWIGFRASNGLDWHSAAGWIN